MTLTILGLLEIGAILANPLGPNKEAFAICHFVNYACSASREIVATDRAPTLTPRMPPEPTVRTESKMDKSVRAEGSDMSAATASPSATDHDLEATIEELKQLVSEQAATRITFPRTSVHRLPWAHTPTRHTPSPAHRASRSSSLASTFFAPRVTNYHKIIMPSSPDCACSTAGNDPQGYAGAGHPVQDGGKPGSEEQLRLPVKDPPAGAQPFNRPQEISQARQPDEIERRARKQSRRPARIRAECLRRCQFRPVNRVARPRGHPRVQHRGFCARAQHDAREAERADQPLPAESGGNAPGAG
mmetsp:Transcript_46545/g.129334  ORF Transcript_46545/g.129334 Transcript_46545/m.129334 type:complete len:302 (+) Transcript_46545:1618-2523(+)